MEQTSIPHDLGLQLPLPEGVLKLLLVILFLLHILFVNFMVGGVTISLIFEIIGLKKIKYDHLAKEISATVTVNKSLAVVLGVAPLLVINLAYTLYFYTANSLTGIAWLFIIPGVIAAFLLTYLHKYTWDKMTGSYKGLHITIAAVSLAIFLFIPLIFLSNVNLMLFPEHWNQIQGFLSAMLMQNVLPRYLHFILATIAVSALFAVGWFGRKGYDVDSRVPGFTKSDLRNKFYLIAFSATLLQIIAGPLLLFTLPVHGISWKLYGFILLGVSSAIMFMILVWFELHHNEKNIGRHFWTIIILLTCTVISMAFGRHYYRERAIAPYNQMVMQNTDNFYWKSEGARLRKKMGISKTPASTVPKAAGETAFDKNCAVCHAVSTTLVGPALTEINTIYPNNPEGIVKWTVKPGIKRGGAVMPPFAHLPETELLEIANYILANGK